jgi:hypothetical protein
MLTIPLQHSLEVANIVQELDTHTLSVLACCSVGSRSLEEGYDEPTSRKI